MPSGQASSEERLSMSRVASRRPSLDWVTKFQAAEMAGMLPLANPTAFVPRTSAVSRLSMTSRLESGLSSSSSAIAVDADVLETCLSGREHVLTLPPEVYDPEQLQETGLGQRPPWKRSAYHDNISRELIAITLFNISFCLGAGSYPLRADTRFWYAMFMCFGVAAWFGALYFLWQRREWGGDRFKAFVLQTGYVYSRMIDVYIWTWIGILYCVYVAALTLCTLPLHFDGAPMPGSRGYMWVLNFFLSFPCFMALDRVSSTRSFKDAAVRKGYPGAAYFHYGFTPRFVLLVSILIAFTGVWFFVCGPIGLYAQTDYDIYALYGITVLNVFLMFQLLPRYANMCKSVDALMRAERRRTKRRRYSLLSRLSGGKAAQGGQEARMKRTTGSRWREDDSEGLSSSGFHQHRLSNIVIAALSTRMAWDGDGADQHIGAGSFRWGKKGSGRRMRKAVEAVGGEGVGAEASSIAGRGERRESEEDGGAHRLSWALRQSVNPLVTVAMGLRDAPRGAVILVMNVWASAKHIHATWRWLAASRPEKFLLSVGYLISGLLLWPVLEVKATTNWASALCVSLALVLTSAVDMFMLLGLITRADQAMILNAAEGGENIGSGLVFSTAALLNALSSGGALPAGFVATEERLVSTAAVSCRWDMAEAWELQVEQTRGHAPLTCRIMFPRPQLWRAALVAWRDRCRYMWIDTLSIPQPGAEDSERLAARKADVLRRLVPTMTSVYATVQHVLIVETACGLEDGPNCYSGRTWTLQECVMNRRTSVVHLDGRLSILGGPSSRVAFTGLSPSFDTSNLDDLSSYMWVLSGEEQAAAHATTPAQRAAWQGFANSRSAARSSDKAVALGQIFFRMLFEHADVAVRFMHEVAVLIATQPNTEPLLLVDNTGWNSSTMSGSADRGRVLVGRPGPMENGDEATWTLRRLPPRNRQAAPPDLAPSPMRRLQAFRPTADSLFATAPTSAQDSDAGMSRPASFPDQLDMLADTFAFADTNSPASKVSPTPSLVELQPGPSFDVSLKGIGKDVFAGMDASAHYSGRRLDWEPSTPSLPGQPSGRLIASNAGNSRRSVCSEECSSRGPSSRGIDWGSTWRESDGSVGADGIAGEGWWLCKLTMRRHVIAVAIRPGEMDYVGRHPCGFLHQMRSCTEEEKRILDTEVLEKVTVSWL